MGESVPGVARPLYRITIFVTLSKHDYELLAEFRYLMRSFLAFSEAAARRAGLTARQHQALLAIKGYPGRRRVSVGELAERLGLRHHSVVGLLDRLASRGLIRRRTSSTDRRQVLIELTGKAETALEDLSRVHRGELKRLAPLLHPLLEQLQKG
jgi:DNA-binding MarR family transcriptional regulator